MYLLLWWEKVVNLRRAKNVREKIRELVWWK